jgi:hypothetical protein
MSLDHFRLFWRRLEGVALFAGIALAVIAGAKLVMLLRGGEIEGRSGASLEPSVTVAAVTSDLGTRGGSDAVTAPRTASQPSTARAQAPFGHPRAQKGQ